MSEKLATQRILAADLVESLEVQKIELAQLEKDRQKKRNGFRKNRKYKQCCLLATDTAETAIQDKREKKDKPIATSIQSEVLDPKGCFISSYHGGDMEGVALRIMMAQGRNIFAEIEAHIKAKIEAEKDLEEEKKTLDVNIPELVRHCEAHGTMFQLLDRILSLLLTKRGMVTSAVLDALEKRLELARVKRGRNGA